MGSQKIWSRILCWLVGVYGDSPNISSTGISLSRCLRSLYDGVFEIRPLITVLLCRAYWAVLLSLGGFNWHSLICSFELILLEFSIDIAYPLVHSSSYSWSFHLPHLFIPAHIIGIFTYLTCSFELKFSIDIAYLTRSFELILFVGFLGSRSFSLSLTTSQIQRYVRETVGLKRTNKC